MNDIVTEPSPLIWVDTSWYESAAPQMSVPAPLDRERVVSEEGRSWDADRIHVEIPREEGPGTVSTLGVLIVT
jgi:hypothetical protein